MEVLSFDIEGKFAHFRKFFANNTAFSFSLPPRTAIMGILAALSGKERDSYYEEFSSDNLRLGAFILEPVKKSFHKLNYLKVEGPADFRGRKKHVQTPFEVVSGINIRNDMVRYRIYMAPGQKTDEVYRQLKEILLNGPFIFNLTLGPANFTARISGINLWNATEKLLNNEEVALHSTVRVDDVNKINFKKRAAYRYNMIEEELMPADFKADYDREVVKMNRVLFTTGGIPLDINMTGKIYVLKNNEETFNIQFLE